MTFTKKNIHLGKFEDKLGKLFDELDKKDFVRRLWNKDYTIWKKDSEYDELIKNRLGWLSLPASMGEKCDEINAFVDEVRNEGYKYAVVLGMGGSSMAPQVFKETFGIKKGFPDFHVLDSTDPVTVFDIENSIAVDKTIFIVSSKSGSTIEVDSFFRYFFEKVKSVSSEPGKNFIAITDPDTSLAARAMENNFRKTFINPADIGGRYSALSYFGLVPAAMIGIDIRKLLENAMNVMTECQIPTAERNSGVVLGTAAALPAKKKKDKLTFIFPKQISSFGYWVEQLIAESTGKESKGILPVEGEREGKINSYSKDRVFVDVNLGKQKKKHRKYIGKIAKVFPVIEINLKNKYDIGGQFYLWEFATAVMGALLGINPFDEPNVKESKDNTSKVLDYFTVNGKLPERVPAAADNGIRIYSNDTSPGRIDAEEVLKKFFTGYRKGDYIALMAYLQMKDETIGILNDIREILRKRFKAAATLGFGPRFLHSTGQYHKGGPGKGLFIQIVTDDSKDIEIPGKAYSFKLLMQSQAIGDYESLVKHNKKVISIDIGSDTGEGLKKLLKLIKKALRQ